MISPITKRICQLGEELVGLLLVALQFCIFVFEVFCQGLFHALETLPVLSAQNRYARSRAIMQSNVYNRGDTSSLKVTNSVFDDGMSIGSAVSERESVLMRRTRLEGHGVSCVTT